MEALNFIQEKENYTWKFDESSDEAWERGKNT